MYEIAALKPPFRAPDMASLYKKVQKGIFERIPKVYSDELQSVIAELLKVQASFRPSCQQILNMGSVMKNGENGMVEKKRSKANLLNTIELPKNLRSLKQMLPKANYENGGEHRLLRGQSAGIQRITPPIEIGNLRPFRQLSRKIDEAKDKNEIIETNERNVLLPRPKSYNIRTRNSKEFNEIRRTPEIEEKEEKKKRLLKNLQNIPNLPAMNLLISPRPSSARNKIGSIVPNIGNRPQSQITNRNNSNNHNSNGGNNQNNNIEYMLSNPKLEKRVIPVKNAQLLKRPSSGTNLRGNTNVTTISKNNLVIHRINSPITISRNNLEQYNKKIDNLNLGSTKNRHLPISLEPISKAKDDYIRKNNFEEKLFKKNEIKGFNGEIVSAKENEKNYSNRDLKNLESDRNGKTLKKPVTAPTGYRPSNNAVLSKPSLLHQPNNNFHVILKSKK